MDSEELRRLREHQDAQKRVDEFRRVEREQDILRRAADPARVALAELRRAANPLQEAMVRFQAAAKTIPTLPKANSLAVAQHWSEVSRAVVSHDLASNARLLGGVIDGLRAQVNTAEFSTSFNSILAQYRQFEERFRIHTVPELAKFTTSIERTAHNLQAPLSNIARAMSSLHSPWLSKENPIGSATSFATIQAMGYGVSTLAPFGEKLTESLRTALGDWRDAGAYPPSIIDDPAERRGYYIGLGFKEELTDFPADAFDEATALAGLASLEDLGEGDAVAGERRSDIAFKQISYLERRLRTFIDTAMTAAFGEGWVRHQLPNNMLDAWRDRQSKAVAGGEAEAPILEYADFSEYVQIIQRRDNWQAAFERCFVRVENVRESLFRLGPPRNSTMHSRLITLEDLLLIRAEIKRLLRAIDATS